MELKNNILEELVRDWSYLLSDGIPDLTDIKKVTILNDNILKPKNLVYSNNSFNVLNPILSEGNTDRSTKAEKILEILINSQTFKDAAALLASGTPESEILNEYYKLYLTKAFKSPEECYERALRIIKKIGLQPPAVNVGDASFGTSEKWITFGGIKNSKSKADIVCKNKNVSVKNGSTKVRILDASGGQLRALILSSLEGTKMSKEVKAELDLLSTTISKILSSTKIKRNVDTSSKRYTLGELSKSESKQMITTIKNFRENEAKAKSKILKLVSEMHNHKDFEFNFLLESLTGNEMFGATSRNAIATDFLCFDEEFEWMRVKSIKDCIPKIASNFKVPSVASKSSHSTIGLTAQAFVKMNDEDLEESINLDTEINHLELLLESWEQYDNVLHENVFDDLIQKIKDKAQILVSRIYAFFESLYNKIVAVSNKSMHDIFEIIGIDLEMEPSAIEANITYENL